MKKIFYHSITFLILLLITGRAWGQAGAGCNNAIPITTLPFTQTAVNTCGPGSNSFGSNALCSGAGGNARDITFTYTPAKNQCMELNLSDINYSFFPDFSAAVSDQCPGGGATNCIYNSGNITATTFTSTAIQLTAGTTYYIVFDGAGGYFGNTACTAFDLRIDTCGATNPPGGCIGGQNPPFMTGTEKGTDCGTNLGFEAGDVSNWNASYNNSAGQYYGPPIAPNVTGFSPAGGITNGPLGACGAFPFNANAVRHSLTSGAVFDPNSDGQIPVVSPSGGNYSFRIGNHEAGRGCECIDRTFTPDAANPIFTYAFAVVLEDPNGHTNNERPRFEITLSDSAGPLSCGGTYSVTSAGRTTAGFTQATTPNCINAGSQIWYRKWSTVSTDLSKYIGKPIKIKFCSTDCGRGGHYGYAYVDAFCQSKKIQGAVLCTTGGSTVLTAPPGFSNYSWYTGTDTTKTPVGSGLTYTASPPDSIFTVVFDQVGTCCATKLMATDTIRMITKQVGGNVTLCNTDTGKVSISASSNDPRATYQWSPSAGLACSTCATTTVQLPLVQTTTYTVTITSNGGCSFTDQVTVTVNICGINVVAYSDNVCEGVCGTLSAIGTGGTAPFTYTWQPGNLTGNTISVCPSSTAIYTVTAMDNGGFTATSVARVNITSKPNITASSDSICGGKTTILTAGGGSTYTWLPATGLSSTTGVSVSANPPISTTYTVIGQSALGCFNSTTAMVNFYPPPAVNAAPKTICVGETTTLTGIGAYEYYWFPTGDTTNTINVSPTATTTYTIIGTSIKGCQNSNTVTVTVNTKPVIAATGNTVCAGNGGTLTASGGTTYTWSPTTGLSNPNSNPVTATPGGTTTYSVVGTDVNGCTNVAVAVLTVNTVPTITVNPQAICAGQNATLTAGGGSTYTWVPGNSTANPLTVTPVVTTTYSVLGTHANGCTNSSAAVVTVTTLPVVKLGNDTTICGTLNLLLNAGNTGAIYSWSTAATTQTINATTIGKYWVKVTMNGCSSSDSINITPANSFNASEAEVCTNDSLILSVGGKTGTYSWSTGASTPEIYVYTGGIYWVTTVNGFCNFIDTFYVYQRPGIPSVIRLPNVFTPNSDNKNDKFDIEGLDYSSDYRIKIYDRWGLLMFESADPGLDWDGLFKGKDSPQGVYYFILEYTDPCHSDSDIKHGFLHLLR